MKRLIIILSIVMLISSFTFFGAFYTESQAKESTVLKFATALPPQAPPAVYAKKIVDNFNKRVEGRYKIEFYPGGSLCTMEESMDMLRSGAIDIVDFPLEYLTGNDQRFAAITLPLIVDDFDAAVSYLDNLNKLLFNDILAEKVNGMPLVTFTTGLQEYFSVKKPVKTLEDWKGLLIWVATAAEGETVKTFGASPVSLPFFDGYPALEKGVVDAGVGANPSAIWDLKYYESIRYITIAHMFPTSAYFLMNVKSYKAMPSDVQKVLLEEAKKIQDELRILNKERQSKCLKDLGEVPGMQVYIVPAEERAKWKEKSRPVIEAYYQKIGPEAAKKIQEAAANANR
jgi:TRAP-type C4-dicarboxylate transport system substrate-binding protein